MKRFSQKTITSMRKKKKIIVLIRIREIASIISIFPRSVIIRVLIILAGILLYSVHRMAKRRERVTHLILSFSFGRAGILSVTSVKNVLSNAVILLPSRARYNASDVRALTQISYDFTNHHGYLCDTYRAFAK